LAYRVLATSRFAAEDEHTAIFAGGRGFLTYRVPRGRDLVVLLRLVWVGDQGPPS
jgi:hypothetical protein